MVTLESYEMFGRKSVFRRHEDEKFVARAEIPLFSVLWCRNGIVLVGGGGGRKGTGISSGVEMCYVREDDEGMVLRSYGFLDSHDQLVYSITEHPNISDRKHEVEGAQLSNDDKYGDEFVMSIGARVHILKWAEHTIKSEAPGQQNVLQKIGLSDLANARADFKLKNEAECFAACVRLSKDGKILAAGGDDKQIHIFQYASGRPRTFSPRPIGILKGHQKELEDLDFDETSRFLASCASEKHCKVWDMKTNEVIAKLEVPNSDLTFKRCRFIGRTLVTFMNQEGRKLRSYMGIWESSNWTLHKFLEIQRDARVCKAQLSRDQRMLGVATQGDEDAALHIYEVNEAIEKVQVVHKCHDLPITDLSFSPSNQRVVTVSADKTTKVFNVQKDSRGCCGCFFLFAFLFTFLTALFYIPHLYKEELYVELAGVVGTGPASQLFVYHDQIFSTVQPQIETATEIIQNQLYDISKDLGLLSPNVGDDGYEEPRFGDDVDGEEEDYEEEALRDDYPEYTMPPREVNEGDYYEEDGVFDEDENVSLEDDVVPPFVVGDEFDTDVDDVLRDVIESEDDVFPVDIQKEESYESVHEQSQKHTSQDDSEDLTQHDDLQHDDLQHDDLQHDDLQHDDLQHDDLQHDYLQHDDLQHDDLQHGDSQHIQHNIDQQNTLQEDVPENDVLEQLDDAKRDRPQKTAFSQEIPQQDSDIVEENEDLVDDLNQLPHDNSFEGDDRINQEDEEDVVGDNSGGSEGDFVDDDIGDGEVLEK